MCNTIRSLRLAFGVVSAALLLSMAVAARGDEPLPDLDAEPPKAKRAPPEERSADEGLLEQPKAGEAGLAAAIDRLERAIVGMRDAGNRLRDDDSGKATQAVQEQVIQDLERLLELLRQQSQTPPPNAAPQPQDKSRKQNQNRPQQSSRQQSQPQNSKTSRQSPSGQTSNTQRSEDEKSRESQEQSDPTKKRPPEEARQRQIVKDVWGHLPPHVREALQHSFSEKYLPKYDELVKRYYEALSEKDRQRTAPGAPVSGGRPVR